MELCNVGSSGAIVSRIVLGTALTIGTELLSREDVDDLIEVAWNLGIRAFDTSNNYGGGEAERLLGSALRGFPREEFALSTKGSWPLGESQFRRGLGRKHLRWALEKSLDRLGVEFVDIYYAHRPDPTVRMDEIVRTFNYFIEEGKIHHWATSQWPLEALQQCLETCDRLGLERPIAEQIGYSFLYPDADLAGTKAFCTAEGMGVFAFSPLAQGILSGKYASGIPTDSRIGKAEMLGYDKTSKILRDKAVRANFFLQTCAEFDVPPVAAALTWVLQRGAIPVVGARSPAQIIEIANALEANIPSSLWEKLKSIEAVS